jgi:rhamnopyranosyl-N-acetylglucosaminyl-diphospho-decaprenol beta-1,3/1,4-galactofuranosyltransferase
MDTVAAVIVTYNRKALLLRAIKAVLEQTRPIDHLFIIDNASTDGTATCLAASGYCEHPVIDYVQLSENTGGAGGFHEGMKRAFDAGYTRLWLMDDDGYPDATCLANLLDQGADLDIVGPNVVQPQDPQALAWPLRQYDQAGHYLARKAITTYAELIAASNDGIYADHAHFFNGVLIHRRVVESVGLVLKEMFIWGDEMEYGLRCRAAQMTLGTSLDSLFFHPEKLSSKFSPIKYYHLFRNTFYIYGKYSSLMYTPLIRRLYPAYIFMKYISKTPSWSPRYLWRVLRAIQLAWGGKLLPYRHL